MQDQKKWEISAQSIMVMTILSLSAFGVFTYNAVSIYLNNLEIADRIEVLRHAKEDLEKEVNNLREQYQKESQWLKGVQQDVSELTEKLNSTQNQVTQQQKIYLEISNKLTFAKQEQAKVEKENDLKKAENVQLAQQNDNLSQEVKELLNQRDRLQGMKVAYVAFSRHCE